MAATDTTTLILEMRQQMEEQRCADLQAAQEKRVAAEKLSGRDMQRIL